MVEETRNIPDAVAAHARSRWSRPDTVPRYVLGVVFIFHCREVVALVNLPRLISLLAWALHKRNVLVRRCRNLGLSDRKLLPESLRFNPARFFTFLLNATTKTDFIRVLWRLNSHGLPYSSQ